MNISKARIAFYLITFQKSKIPQYLLDCGNNWVNGALADATKENIKSALVTGKSVLDALSRYSWLCPEKWREAYEATVAAFAAVVAACDDLNISMDEVMQVMAAFNTAYAKWCAE